MKFTAAFSALLAILPVALAGNHFYGIGASNSVGGSWSYTCRSQQQWDQMAREARDAGFASIRITGFDCDALERASSAAAKVGIKVLAGIWVNGSMQQGMTQINNDVQTFRAAYAKYGAGRYAGLTVGNEVNDSAWAIMEKVYDVRGYLHNVVNVQVPVSTVHTWVRIRDEPVLCGADFVAANAHAFYDGNRRSDQAGDFMRDVVVPSLKGACPGKNVVITETGWPSRGGFGVAAGSNNDEEVALTTLNCYANRDKSVQLYAFEYDDQLWKGDDPERNFGIFGKVYFRDC